MTDDHDSPMGNALISEALERDWRTRVRAIANYNYQGTRPTRTSLWWQVSDLAAVAADRHGFREYRTAAVMEL